MSESKHENESGLIIDPAILANILAACRHREAELGAAGGLALPPAPATLSEAERFAAAVADMPPRIRAFFQAEEPTVSPQQWESDQDRLEREVRASLGGWPGG